MEYMQESNLPRWENFSIGIRYIKAGKHNELNLHDHHFSEIVLILNSGGAVHWAEGRSHELKRGDVLLLHPGRVHGYQNCKSLELVNILYKADRLPLPLLDGADMELFHFFVSAKCAGELIPEAPVLSLKDDEIDLIEKQIKELDGELNDDLPGRNLRVFILFMGILTSLGRMGKCLQKREMVNETSTGLSYLNMHFREPVSIDHLAKISNQSKRSFFRHFRELTGMTPVEYCRRKQLEYASDLLRSSNLTLAEIAVECGFCDSNYMIKLFSQVFGKTPGKYRKDERNSSGRIDDFILKKS
ncbi:MAG: helix-turn-helix domain-containing protein [Lentisphaeria bacterium]|nr:helix-turn-helix domain-containing protein [Lentisphaeria bacterium]